MYSELRGAAYLLLAASLTAAPAQLGLKQSDQVRREFGSIPLYLEPNLGQADGSVRFLSRTASGSVAVLDDGLVLSKGTDRVAIHLSGITRKPKFTAEDKLEGVSHYYLGSRVIENTPHFARVRASQVRPGLDVVYYGNARQLEYDLIFGGATHPETFTIRLDGGAPSLTEDGDLIVKSGSTDFRQHRPVAWQKIDGKRVPVECRYVLLRPGEVGFELGKYDRQRPLVIDPILSYSTYLGGLSGNDEVNGIAVDATGAAIVAGGASSSEFPVTSGILQGATNVFVSKLAPGGNSLQWSVFIGGNSIDKANAITIDSSGAVYVTGSTTSSSFPGQTRTSHTDADIFVAKLSAAGNLVYSRVFGGNSTDYAMAIAVDSGNQAYLTGITYSNIATAVAYRSPGLGGSDAFIAKFSSAGTMVWCAQIGGSGEDFGTGIAVDAAGNTYITGSTMSSNFPAVSAMDGVFHGVNDAFVTELNAFGTALIYSSFLGGSNSDQGSSIVLSASGLLFVGGYTNSVDFPTTPRAFRSTEPNFFYSAGFVAAFAPGLPWVTKYVTYLGSNGYLNALAVNASGEVLATGSTAPEMFQTTPGALRQTAASFTGHSDSFLARISADGTTLVYATLLGSDRTGDQGRAIALDTTNGVYVAGISSDGSGFPTTAGSFQPTLTKNNSSIPSGTITKVDIASPTVCQPAIAPTTLNVSPQGGTANFTLTLAAGCPWEAITDSGVTISGAKSGMGSSTAIPFNATVTPNDSAYSARNLSVRIGTATLSIAQPQGSCSLPVFSPSSLSFDSAGGIRTVTVTIPSTCTWSPASAQPWLSVQSAASGTLYGTQTLSVFAAPNSFATRSTSLLVNGVSLPVSQTGGTCTSSVTTTPSTFAGSGGSGSVVINTTASSCSWAVYSTVPWIQVNSAAAVGTGSGAIPLKIAANPGSAPRSGNVLVGDKMVPISESAGPSGSAATSYTTSNYAGGGPSPGPNDGLPATQGYLSYPTGLAFSANTGLIIADPSSARIRQVDLGGIIHTIAGGGNGTTDGTAATSAQLDSPNLVAADPTSGTVYFADRYRVRAVSAGRINTVAGTGIYGNAGDGGPATSARLGTISALAVDSSGNVYIGDSASGIVRKVSSGIITTIAGGGSQFGDGGPATQAVLGPIGLAVSPSGDLYIADGTSARIRKISGGVITTVAGGGNVTGTGTIPATSAQLQLAGGLALDSTGSIYFTEPSRIRTITPDGLLYTASNIYTSAIAADNAGNIYFTNSSNTVGQATPVPNFCSYSINDAAQQPASGGSATITVTTASGCSWNAITTAPWLTIGTPASGTATGSFVVTVAPNKSGVRSAAISVGGETVTITQSGTLVNDFNQDGAADIIFQDQTSGWAQVWYLGGPKGITITNAANLTLQNKWRIVGIADFNQDGKPDVLWQDTAGAGTVQLWSMGGANGNQITNAVNIIASTPTRVVAIGDFDLDGHPDLVLQDPTTGASTIWFFGGTSGTTSLGTAKLSGNNPWKIAAAGDFNGDGRVDVIWQDQTSGFAQIWFLTGTQGNVLADAANLVQKNPWRIAAAADLNQDGRVDVIWQDPATGASQAWFMGGPKGNQILDAASLGGPNPWKIAGPR